MEWDDIRAILDSAISDFMKHDRYLLEVNANERSLTHQFATYMKPLFSPYHVDCEYNRDGYDPKRVMESIPTEDITTSDEEARTVFPDIIVHRRGSAENLLVIEAKKSSGDQSRDIRKLHLFVDPTGLGYHYGVSLLFETRGEPTVTYELVAQKDER